MCSRLRIVWGGTATIDDCGVRDTDPDNNNTTCVHDCALVWVETATIDNCGTCDTDSSNDCVQDCSGDWGGILEFDCQGVCNLCYH